MWLGPDCNRDHVVGRRHLEIQRLVDLGLQSLNVLVANMATVFAQMRGDAVGTGRDRKLCGPYRIRMASAARIVTLAAVRVEPAFWVGQPRTHVGTFEDYFLSNASTANWCPTEDGAAWLSTDSTSGLWPLYQGLARSLGFEE